MTLSVGILLGVMAKKRKKGLSRLRQFRQKLKKQNKGELSLYQIPAKIIFSILFIIALATFLEYFLIQCQQELLDQTKHLLILQPTTPQSFQNNELITIQNHNSTMQVDHNNQVMELRKMIYYIHGFLLFIFTILMLMLHFKVINMNKKERTVVMTKYEMFGMKISSQKYLVRENDRVEIWMMGEERFSNNNYYYSIVIVDAQIHSQIIQKSNLFHARTAAITLGTILQIPYSVKIIKKTNANIL